MIRFGADICSNLQSSLGREWLDTNGLGGFASSTIIGLNTRRYHVLLVAATQPPTGRLVLLSKLEATLILNGREYQFGVQSISGRDLPRGFSLPETVPHGSVSHFDLPGGRVGIRAITIHGPR